MGYGDPIVNGLRRNKSHRGYRGLQSLLNQIYLHSLSVALVSFGACVLALIS